MGTWTERTARYEKEYGGRDGLANRIRQVIYAGDMTDSVQRCQEMDDASWQMVMARRVRNGQLAELDSTGDMLDLIDLMSNVRFRLGLLAYLDRDGKPSDVVNWPEEIAVRLNRSMRKRAEVLGEYETDVDLGELCERLASDEHPFSRKERFDILVVTEANLPEFILTAMTTDVNAGNNEPA